MCSAQSKNAQPFPLTSSQVNCCSLPRCVRWKFPVPVFWFSPPSHTYLLKTVISSENNPSHYRFSNKVISDSELFWRFPCRQSSQPDVTHLRSGHRRWRRCVWWVTARCSRAGQAPSSHRWGPMGALCPPYCWQSSSESSAGTSTHRKHTRWQVTMQPAKLKSSNVTRASLRSGLTNTILYT